MGRLLKFAGVLLLFGWFIGFLYALIGLVQVTGDSTASWWYAYIAGLNNITFGILVSIPVFLLYAPVGLLAEWLADKGTAIEEAATKARVEEREAIERALLSPPSIPQAKPEPTAEELEELRKRTREESEKTAAYLANYFGPLGPSKPKPSNKYASRGRARRRY